MRWRERATGKGRLSRSMCTPYTSPKLRRNQLGDDSLSPGLILTSSGLETGTRTSAWVTSTNVRPGGPELQLAVARGNPRLLL